MPLVKAEKSRVIVLFDWKDMVHDRTTGDACYQTSNVTMKYKTSIVVLLVMVHQCMHCHFPLVTSIMRLILKRPWLPASANQNQTRESDESGEFLCGWGLFNGILFPQSRQVKQLAMLTLVPLQRKKIKDLFLKANKLTKK